MSRFVDRSAVERLDLGGGDWVDLRKELSGTEWAFGQRSTARFLSVVIAAWNLEDDAGAVMPINMLTTGALDEPTFRLIDDWIAANIPDPTLPNAPSEPSPGGSQEPPTPTRTTSANGSTTPSWQPTGVSGTSTTPAPSS